ncbi:MAG: hypothetical protein AAF636_11375 [Pseudomonadota bacterium]
MKTKSFATQKLRQDKLDELISLRYEQGKQALRVDAVKYRRWMELEQRAGAPLDVVVDFYLKNQSICPVIEKMVDDYFFARELHFAVKQKKPAMDTSEVQLRATRKRLGNFAAAFRGTPPDRISVAMCREWMQSLLLAYSPKTVMNYRTEVMMFYNHLIREEALTSNPMAGVRPPDVIAEEYPFYSVQEALRFFRTNQDADPELTALVALGAFAGLRTSALLRLRKSDISKSPRGLKFAASGQKKAKRYFIENFPDNLWEWIQWMPKSALGMGQQQFYRRRTKAYKRAGIDAKDNGWRHAFATHHSCWKQSAKETAYLLQHRSQTVLWDTYKGNASQRNGRLYFKIVPRENSK